MRPFTYERATDPAAALAAASRAGAKFISGGTNLLDLMKLEIERPTHLIDISRLPLKEIEALPNGGLRVGAQATNSVVAADARVRTRYPVLSQALVAGASGQPPRPIQNRHPSPTPLTIDNARTDEPGPLSTKVARRPREPHRLLHVLPLAVHSIMVTVGEDHSISIDEATDGGHLFTEPRPGGAKGGARLQ